MAAKNYSEGGATRYYSVSYGKLATTGKDIPEGAELVERETLKSLTYKVENVDLRNKYVDKGSGSYPIITFYDAIEGQIVNFKKDVFDKGVSLSIGIVDTDGDNSTVQTKFYSKYTEDFLNRLLSVRDINANLLFSPYSIPNDFEDEKGNKRKFYSQGVSIREGGNKVERFYSKDNGNVESLPQSERLIGGDGQPFTSRVKRIDFLFEQFSNKFQGVGATTAQEQTQSKPAQAKVTVEVEDDDLPF